MISKHKSKPSAIFTYGESIFDSQALKELLAAARPDAPAAQSMARPMTLRRNAHEIKHKHRSDLVVRALKAAQVKYAVAAIISHRDLDALEPAEHAGEASADEEEHKINLQAVAELGIQIITTSPAWEIEAWWLMWPQQVSKFRPTWKALRDRSGKRVDLIQNAKENLILELRPSGKARCIDYSETDAPRIAEQIRLDGVIRNPKGVSIAFQRFLLALDTLPSRRDASL